MTLQEFGYRVQLLCALETGGKLKPNEAYEQIKDLWNRLEQSTQKQLKDFPPSEPEP